MIDVFLVVVVLCVVWVVGAAILDVYSDLRRPNTKADPGEQKGEKR